MIKNLLSKVKSKSKLLVGSLTGALAAAVMSVAAFAEDGVTGTAAAPTMGGVIKQAGDSFQGSIGELVTAVVPVILGAFGVALIIFGVMWLIKTVKKVFTKSSN